MSSMAFGLIQNGIMQSATPRATYAEIGVRTGGSGWLACPAPLPSSTQHLWFMSYECSQDSKKTLVGFKSTNGRQGLTQDWNSTADGVQTPELEVRTDVRDIAYEMAPLALGDRVHILISQQIIGTDAHIIAYVWDETSGAWSEAINALETDGTFTAFPYGTLAGTSLFANVNASRKVDLVSYRAAFWTASELSGGLPDISQASVRNNFAQGLHIADPAISRAAFGAPLYDIHGDATVYNAGTNLGSGGDFTVNGTFT